MSKAAPSEQHLRFVLWGAAPKVVHVGVEYVAADGSPAAGADLGFAVGAAPRIVSHDPKLPDGSYRLRIDVQTRDIRKLTERQVTLAGATVSVDLVDLLDPK